MGVYEPIVRSFTWVALAPINGLKKMGLTEGLTNPYKCGVIYRPLLVTAWRIIPVSKWLITMVIVSSLSRVIPLPNGHSWLINVGY